MGVVWVAYPVGFVLNSVAFVYLEISNGSD